MDIDPFFLEHFDVVPAPTYGKHAVQYTPKTWEARDYIRLCQSVNVHREPRPLIPVTKQFLKAIFIPRFISEYRFNTRKHPKRGEATHASVNT
jgi:hypothetical protein